MDFNGNFNDFNEFDEDDNIDDLESQTLKIEKDDRLSTRIFDMIKQELMKLETKQKLKCIIDPLSFYLLNSVQPYVISIIIIMILVLICQGYLIMRLWWLQQTIALIKL